MSLPLVLITGFEPFDGDAMNPSLEVVRQLDGSVVDDSLRLHALELPCVFGRSLELLLATVDELRPAAVLALGLAFSAGAQAIDYLLAQTSTPPDELLRHHLLRRMG